MSKGVSTEEKNFQHLLKLLTTSINDFAAPVFQLQRIFGLVPSRNKALEWMINYPKTKKHKVKKDDLKFASQKLFEFVNSKSSAEFDNLFSEIEMIVRENKLGIEWISTIFHLIVSGIAIPPKYNLYIELNKDEDSVKITINSTTSKEDISEAWEDIKKPFREMPENGKRIYYSRNLINDLYAYFRGRKLKNEGMLDEDSRKYYRMYDSDLAEMFMKKLSKKNINKLRQKRRRIKEKMK